jgi:hypothetical protein
MNYELKEVCEGIQQTLKRIDGLISGVEAGLQIANQQLESLRLEREAIWASDRWAEMHQAYAEQHFATAESAFWISLGAIGTVRWPNTYTVTVYIGNTVRVIQLDGQAWRRLSEEYRPMLERLQNTFTNSDRIRDAVIPQLQEIMGMYQFQHNAYRTEWDRLGCDSCEIGGPCSHG